MDFGTAKGIVTESAPILDSLAEGATKDETFTAWATMPTRRSTKDFAVRQTR
jgi:hypothetical protein